jgi:KDO2-lipid IV(A) lauroyltransferase
VGPQVSERALHEMVRRVFAHAGQANYDFFRAVSQPVERVREAVRLPAQYMELMRKRVAEGRGVLVLGLHISNFDLAMAAIAAHGLPVQILSVANPGAGFSAQNRLRAQVGAEVTPITAESLRLAVRRLRTGWTVFTGGDRPALDQEERVEFFGHSSRLPVGPARLARLSGAEVLVAGCHYAAETGYVVRFVGPVEMVRSRDRQKDFRENSRRLAATYEPYMRAHPAQWLMFHPVWDDGD